jgi:hypothetical protein
MEDFSVCLATGILEERLTVSVDDAPENDDGR